MPFEPPSIDTLEAFEPPSVDSLETLETQSPGFLGPSWPSGEGEGEGESIAEPDPERERKKAELANQMRLARAERGLSDVIESFIGGAARAVEPLTPSGLMNQPTRIAGAITGKPIPDIYQPGKPLINVPQPSGTGVMAGLGQLGAQTLSGLTTPEMIVTGPALPVSSAARAIMAGEMAAGLPESIARGGEVLRAPEATVAEKVVAAGQPIITAAMVRGLGQTAKWLPEVERTIAKAEPILPQAAQAAREAQKGETQNASEISKATEVYGDVRPQPVEGARQVPVEEGGAGIQPQTGGGIPEAQASNAAQESGRVLLSEQEWEKLGVKYARRPDGTLKTKEEYTPEEWKTYVTSVIDAKVKQLEKPAPKSLTPEERLAEQRALDESLGQETTKPTPLPEATPTVPPAAEPSQLTPTQQGSKVEPISKATTPLKESQVGNAPTPSTEPFLGKTKGEWKDYWKSLNDTQKQQVISQANSALKGEGLRPRLTKESKGPAVIKAIHELLDLREKKKAAVAKEPWQMTKAEWNEARSNASQAEINALKSLSGSPRQKSFAWGTPERIRLEYGAESAKRTSRSVPVITHKAVIEKAIREGRPVPPEVLADYPELSQQPPLPPGPGAKTVGEPPYAAAQQLTDQLRATKPTGTKDTYSVRQKLADAWAEGKSLFDRALASSRVTAEGLKDTARGVRAITDLDRRIGELDWLLQKSAAQSRNMGKAIEQQQKSKATREAVALWIDAGGNEQLLRETLANLPAKTKPSIRRALEVAANLPPEAKQFAQQIEQFYGIRLQDAQQAEIFSKSLDDYFTHIWKKESNMPEKLRAAYSTGRVNDYFQFARQRKLPMFLDGILQGKVPELDPAKVVPYYNYALDRSIASRQFVKELSEVNAPDGRPAVLPTGTARKIEPNEEGAQGGIFINPKGKGELGKDYHVIDHPAMRKWKWLGADENGNPVMYRSDLAANPLVHERLARMLDQRLATPSKVGKQLLRASTEVKGFKLGLLSAFHQVHVGSHALFHWTNPFKTGDIDWESPATKYAVEKGHLKLAGDAAQIANFSEGLLSPGLVHKIPIVGPWSKAYSEWLFTDWIPRLKLKTFENALPRNLAWFAKDIKAGKITPEQVAARVGDSVNNAYGELNHWFLGKSGRSPQFQRILRGIFLAPDFGEARLRFVEKAFTKYGWEERMALATMFLTLYTGARVANWLSHGDPETDLKNAFRVKVKLPGKDKMEWVSMRSVVGDLVHALTGFGQFMYVRLNPLYSRTISDVLFQRDVYGRKLSFGDIAFKRPAQQLVPINLTGLTREDQSLWESAITSAGLQVQHDVPAMDIGKLKRQWLLASEDPKLRTIGEHGEASIYPPSDYAPLRRALASGDLEKAGAEYDALIKDKGKKRADIVDALSWYSGGKEVNGVYRERKVKPIGGQIGAEAEKKFIASLNPAEKRLYQQAMDERKRIYQKFLEMLKSR